VSTGPVFPKLFAWLVLWGTLLFWSGLGYLLYDLSPQLAFSVMFGLLGMAYLVLRHQQRLFEQTAITISSIVVAQGRIVELVESLRLPRPTNEGSDKLQ
jgi:hypothetical protein